MDLPGVPAGWDSPADRPSVLQITVEPGPGRRTGVRRRNVLIAGLGTLPALAAAALIAVLPGSSGDSLAPPARTPAIPIRQAPKAPPPFPRAAPVLVDRGMRYPDTPLAESPPAHARYLRVTG